jgi:hypothetical protein
MTVGEHCPIISVGAAIGTVFSASGRPTIGLAIVVVFSVFFVFTSSMDLMLGLRALQIDETGVRLFFRDSSFFVAWKLITQIAVRGADLYTTTEMHVVNRLAVGTTAIPDTPSTRAKVTGLFVTAGNDDGVLTLPAWLGGVDARHLVPFLKTFSSDRSPDHGQ